MTSPSVPPSVVESSLSGNVTLDDATLEPPREYLALLGVATHLMPGVKHLGRSKETRKEAFTLISGHATECLLKAIILKPGSATVSLKDRTVRHNLTELWNLAASRCSTLATGVPKWVSALDEFHDDPYAIRYMKGIHMYSLPPHKLILVGLEMLCAKTTAFLGCS